MKTTLIALSATLLLSGSLSLQAQNRDRPRGDREQRQRPDFFALSDLDKNGSVTFDELVKSRIQMMQRRGGQQGGRPPREGQDRPQRDGQAPDPAEMEKRMKERMAEAFKKADKDKNGALSREEFQAMPQGPAGGRGGPGGGRPGGGDGSRRPRA